jgi:hypothetical protein
MLSARRNSVPSATHQRHSGDRAERGVPPATLVLDLTPDCPPPSRTDPTVALHATRHSGGRAVVASSCCCFRLGNERIAARSARQPLQTKGERSDGLLPANETVFLWCSSTVAVVSATSASQAEGPATASDDGRAK